MPPVFLCTALSLRFILRAFAVLLFSAFAAESFASLDRFEVLRQ